MGKIRKSLAILAVMGSVSLFIMPPPANMNVEMMRAGALVLFTIVFLATSILPEYMTALIFILMSILFNVAPPSVIFSGFSSKAIWLVFGGLTLATAVKRTGLGERMAGHLLVLFGTSYLRVLIGIVSLTLLAGFFMPSGMGRMVLLVPIVVAMTESLGFDEKAPGRKGMLMAVLLGCFVPACAILPSNVPNMVLAGASESLYSITFRYSDYLKFHFPVIGILKGLAIVLLVYLMYPDRIPSSSVITQRPKNRLSKQERRLIYILIGTLLLWVTDFLHGISPAWVALAASLLCMLPWSKVLPAEAFSREVNMGPFFYVAGILGMGAVITKTELDHILGRELLRLINFSPGNTMQNFFLLSLLYMVLVMIVTAPGLPAMMVPLSADIAKATGFPLMTVLMAEVIGFSTPLLFYPVPPLIVGMQLCGLKGIETAKLTLTLAGLSILIIMPIHYLWWSFLGLFGSS